MKKLFLCGLFVLLIVFVVPVVALTAVDDNFVNTDPLVGPQIWGGCVGSRFSINVLVNDIPNDPNTPSLTVEITQPPQHGSVRVGKCPGEGGWGGTNSICYSVGTYSGPDILKYRLYDGHSYSNEATVYIQINRLVKWGGIQYTFFTPEDTQLTSNPAVLDGCLVFPYNEGRACLISSGVSHGKLTFSNGELVEDIFYYIPNAGFSGTDQFNYKVEWTQPDGVDGFMSGDKCLGAESIVFINVGEQSPSQTPAVSFNKPDTAICQFGCYNPPISAVVSGLGADQKVDLQLTYKSEGTDGSNRITPELKYILENVGNGEYPITPQMFGISCLWPGIELGPDGLPDAKKIEIFFGATLLDWETHNSITPTAIQEYYWNPWVCTAPPIPEFPSMFLPVAMIIGFLGAVLLIQRTREH